MLTTQDLLILSKMIYKKVYFLKMDYYLSYIADLHEEEVWLN